MPMPGTLLNAPQLGIEMWQDLIRVGYKDTARPNSNQTIQNRVKICPEWDQFWSRHQLIEIAKNNKTVQPNKKVFL